ncbi:MAG: Gfo/Idh/MocA family protein, partial [Bacteroidota bacterium]
TERTGAHFCPCYAHRLTAASTGLTRLFRDHAIGDIWSFEAVWMTSSVALRGPDHWLFHREYSAGGILTWLACHWLDLLRHLFACEVQSVMAMVATKANAAVDVEDTAALILRFENGAIGTVRAGYSLSPFPGYLDSDLYLQFEGSEGSITYLPQGDTRTTIRSNQPQYANWTRPPTAATPREGYGGDVLASFLRAVQDGGEPPASEVDAWRVMQVIEAAYESSATGRQVQLP